MDRNDFQNLARIRIKEAKGLIDCGLYDGAYYLAGYAVECALKARIAKKTRKYEFPDKDRVNQSHTHKLVELLRIAELEQDHKKQLQADPQFKLNWNTVSQWKETSRYETRSKWHAFRFSNMRIQKKSRGEVRAREIYAAIVGRRNGVLAWLKKYW